ncbi:hypothetical protein OCK74_12085 [Chitinophagaceae bacterium LB-8]|uniref:Uncharacterized protein n=1 Tax=Paraflavisolibacter caeni TaxID=2982496 RepID=A0A9X3B8J4_9BACT|nr:hypothetical protein [Paraflavisolibacter caeni]MCU7549861.1 hypothetical protein [Paraflavisolibacter caeni]
MKKRFSLFIITLFIHYCSHSQITLGSLTKQSIKINQDITFTGSGGTITLKDFSIETTGIITFTDTTINLDGVTIKCDSIVKFSNASPTVNVTNVVDISCKTLTFPAILLRLNGIDTVAAKGAKTDAAKATKESPALTLRFSALTPSSYKISCNKSLSYSIIRKGE